jgi:hypothetical protein
MSKQTAVEWLIEQIVNHNGVNSKTFEKAKAMEREQIIDALDAGYEIAQENVRFKHIRSHGQYYNETYKGGEQ